MKKVLIVATVQSHIAQFHKAFIKALKENNYLVHVAAKNNLDEKNGLKLEEPDKTFDIPFSRSPFSFRNIKAYKQLKELILKNKYDIIHCHTPMGGVLTRVAAKKSKAKVFYTSHGFHFYKGAPIKNWLLYYPIEKKLSKNTDIIFTINEEDFQRANKKFNKTKIIKTNGVGFNIQRLTNITEFNICELFPNVKTHFVITLIGELNDNKNQKFVIEALGNILIQKTNIIVLIVGNGPNSDKLLKIINKNKLENNIKLLGYRTDISGILNKTDVVISASKREGLGQNIIEAMFTGKIIMASNVRGHRDLIIDGQNGFMFNLKNKKEITSKFLYILENYNDLNNIKINAKNDSLKYKETEVNSKMISIYNGELE